MTIRKRNINPNLYLGNNYLVLDFEVATNHGDYGHAVHKDNGLLLACWKTAAGDCVAHRGSEFDQDKLLACIEAADFLVAHNAKYELGWLKRCGMNLHEVSVFDTKIAEYVLLGNLAAGDKNMAPRSTSLDHCCRRRGWKQKDPVIDIWMNHGVNPITMPGSWLEGRCRQDVESTEALFLDQREALDRSGRLGVLLTRCLITPMLADMEFTGMKLDKARVEKAFKEHTKRYAELDAELEEFTGGINWGSTKQLAAYLYSPTKGTEGIESGLGFAELRTWKGEPKRTPTGRKLTDERTLDSLRATTNKQREFLRLRKEIGKLKAALTKNLEFFLGVCKEQKGIFNAVFNQTVTATHRLSSSGIPITFKGSRGPKSVQFQNLPRKFKPLFTPRKRGWVMAEADGAQLEFRVAAHLGNDARAIEGILAGEDVHTFTAAVLNGIEEHEVTDDQRTAAKPDTFKPLYGGQSGTKAQMEYYAAFREKYPDISFTQESWVHDVLEHKRLITPWGMRYYWPYA
ncbi:MAG: DNA polymerase [Nitrosopumilus sp.]